MKNIFLFLFFFANVAYPLSFSDQAQLGVNARNYIKNSGAETGRAGWITYADAAGTLPVDCTGGSPASTWTVSATTPLSGAYSFLWTHSANNRQGEGASYAFTIDNADQARLASISFDYEVASGTFVAGVVPIGGTTAVDSDLEVYIYDVTNTTIIQPSNFRLLQNSGKSTFKGTFQTASNSTSYRLCVHAATTSTAAHTVRVDSVRVGPQTVVTGPPVTDWTSYTPAFTGFGSVVTQSFWYRRVGDSLQVHGTFTCQTSTGTEARVSIPFTTDTSKISSALEIVGISGRNGNSTTFFGDYVTMEGAKAYLTFSAQSSTGNNLTKQNGNTLCSSGELLTVQAVGIPILGWASNVAMGSDADGRVVTAQATGNPASATSGNPIIFPTITFDTHGNYSGTTGKYTVSVPGFYRVHGAIVSGDTGVGLNVYVNAVSGARAGATDSNGEGTFSTLVSVKSGDLIDIRPDNTLDASAGAINFERISGQAQIAQSETLVAKYHEGGTQSVNGATKITFAASDKIIDSHGIFDDANDRLVVPVAGTYLVTGTWRMAATAVSVSGTFKKTGASGDLMCALTANGTNPTVCSASEIHTAVAGDYFELWASSGGAINFQDCTLSIQRIGN